MTNVVEEYNFNIGLFVGFIVWIVCWCKDMNNIKIAA